MTPSNLEQVEPGSTLDFGRSLGFVFKDSEWGMKIFIGSLFSLLSFVGIGAVFLLGHNIRVLRNRARGEENPLPDWSALGEIFIEGLQGVGIALAYTFIPALLLVVPAILVPVTTDPGGEPPAAIVVLMVIMLVAFFGLLLVALLLLPAAITRFAVECRFSAAFEIEVIFRWIKRNFLNYVLAFAVTIVAQTLSQFGILLCCVGVFPATVWAGWAYAYALGEVALRDSEATVG